MKTRTLKALKPFSPVKDLIEFSDPARFYSLLGPANANLNHLRQTLELEFEVKDTSLMISGERERIELAKSLLNQCYEISSRSVTLSQSDFVTALKILASDRELDVSEIIAKPLNIPGRKLSVNTKNASQRAFVDNILAKTLVFGIGPAGTGKTFLAVAVAVKYLLEHRVSKIVLSRPAVESGEKLGFLPGDIAQKVHPYLLPLYDSLYDLLDKVRVEDMIQRGQIEVAPLAFLRGRTLSKAFVVLDEAQNCSIAQMRMFLTRLGEGSKCVVTGDPTQIDLALESGFEHAAELLRDTEDVATWKFSASDVVRSGLAQRIVAAYEQNDSKTRQRGIKASTKKNRA